MTLGLNLFQDLEMFVKRKRLLSIAVLFTLTILLPGTWWMLSDQEPGEQKVAAGSAPAGMEMTGFSGPATPGPIEPFVVNLADIAPGQFDPHNKLDRWLAGKVDFSKRHRLVSDERFNALRAASPLLPQSLGVQDADDSFVTPSSSATTGSGIDSIDYTGCCGGGGNVPPDPEMAAGPNHLIAVVNVAFEIYDKETGASTTAGIPRTFESFMSANSRCTNVFDPNVLYDEEADRFILGIATTGGYYCIAVSQTSDPTGSWNIYALPTYVGPGPEFFDFPHAGVGEDAIYVGANIFKARTFKEGRIFALNKEQMYAGATTSFRVRSLGSVYDTPQPLNLHGHAQGTWPSSGKHYFFSDKNFNGRTYAVHSWDDPFGTNIFTEVGEVDLNAFTGVTAGMPLNFPQQTGGTLAGGDWRPQDFEYSNGFGWTAMTIACNPGGGTVNCVRWAKINLADASVADAGVYASNGTYRSYADLAANACGDMAVGYTKSDNDSIWPSIWYSGRESGDPDGVLQAESVLMDGQIEYTSFEPNAPRRWGDYTGMTIDPDGTTFWYLGEYSKDTGDTDGHWGTYITSFSFTGCDPSGTPTNQPPTANAGSDQTVTDTDENGSQLVTLNGAGSTDDVGIVTYVWTDVPAGNVIANVASTDIELAVGGPYTFRLTVGDGEFTDFDDVVITVVTPPANQAPTANAGSDQTVDGGASVTLDGSGSSDPNDDPLTYQWTQTAGALVTLSSSTAQKPSFTAPTGPDTVTFDLVVNDGTLSSAADEVVVNVNAPVVGGPDPVVASCTPPSGNPGQTYTVAVTGSNFQDGATVDFGERIAVQRVIFIGPSELEVRIRVHNRAALEPREVRVTNPDNYFGSLAACFTVN